MAGYLTSKLQNIAVLGVALLGLTPATGHAKASFNDPADVKALTAIEEALATQTDMKNLIGYFAPNAFVEDFMAPGIYRGKKQIEDAFTAQFSSLKSMQSKIQDISIASNGKFACAALRTVFDLKMKDGTASTVSLRQLDGFKKIDGKWQIVQEHISVPLDQKTGMAAMNEKLPVRGPLKFAGNPLPGPATTPTKAKAEIKQWLITGAPVIDIDEMVKYLGPGDEALLYDLTTPGEYRGQKEIHDAYAPLLNSLTSAKDKLLDYVIDSDGEFGMQIDTQNLQINGKDKSSKIISFRQSDCLRREGGKWNSFFEMLSFPVDMKTGKSITKTPGATVD